MKVVAIVPIKLNNERVPGKNLKKFYDGQPLLSFILYALQNACEVDEVYVYCSNEIVKDYLPEKVHFLKRSAEYDTASADVNSMFLEFSKTVDADIYVLAHATAPFLSTDTINEAVCAVKSGNYDSAFTVKKMQEFLWMDGTPNNYNLNNIPRTQDLQPFYIETTGMYVYAKSVIVGLHRRIGNKPYLVNVSEIESIDINHPIDFEIANAVYKCIIKNDMDKHVNGGGGVL